MGLREKLRKKKPTRCYVDSRARQSPQAPEYSYQVGSHRVAVAKDVEYHQTQPQFEAARLSPAARGRSSSSNTGQRSIATVHERSSSTGRHASTSDGAKNQSRGWNPYIAGAAVGLGAFLAPVVAVGAVAATGCAVTAAGATMIANHMSDNNRRIEESKHRSEVSKAAIEAERVLRSHEISVTAQRDVLMKYAENGYYLGDACNGSGGGRRGLEGYNRLMIEDLSDSE